MHRPPYSVRALAAGAILLLSLIVFRSYLPYAGSALVPKEPPKVVMAMSNAYFVGLNKHGKLWSLKARSVEIGQNRSVTTLSGISDGKIFDSGRLTFKLRAGRAIYDSHMDSLRLYSGMMIQGRNGQQITADGAEWNSASSTLRSNGQVRFRSDGSETIADSLAVDLKRKELTMDNISGAVDLDKAGMQQQEAGHNAR